MRSIDAHNIGTCLNKFINGVFRIGGRTQGGNNFSFIKMLHNQSKIKLSADLSSSTRS